jgi:hypothetical protein
MWGSDATRTAGLHTMEEAAGYIRDTEELSKADKDLVLGGALRHLFGWRR